MSDRRDSCAKENIVNLRFDMLRLVCFSKGLAYHAQPDPKPKLFNGSCEALLELIVSQSLKDNKAVRWHLKYYLRFIAFPLPLQCYMRTKELKRYLTLDRNSKVSKSKILVENFLNRSPKIFLLLNPISNNME